MNLCPSKNVATITRYSTWGHALAIGDHLGKNTCHKSLGVDEAELRAVYDINTNTPSCRLVAALREHLQDVNPNRLFTVVPLPHAASTDIPLRQHQALVRPGMQIADDLVDAMIWWFNTNLLAQGGVWVPHLGWAHTLIAPPTNPRPAPSTRGRERAAPQPKANALNVAPYKGLAERQSSTAPDRGRNLRNLVERYPPGRRRHTQDPHDAKMTLAHSP